MRMKLFYLEGEHPMAINISEVAAIMRHIEAYQGADRHTKIIFRNGNELVSTTPFREFKVCKTVYGGHMDLYLIGGDALIRTSELLCIEKIDPDTSVLPFGGTVVRLRNGAAFQISTPFQTVFESLAFESERPKEGKE